LGEKNPFSLAKVTLPPPTLHLPTLSPLTNTVPLLSQTTGNHAQALALAAATRGVKAYVVMPAISTPSKIAATQGYGADVVFSGSTAAEREAVTRDVIARTGAILVPPYDHPNIILGQGTQALELERQVEELLHAEAEEGQEEGKKKKAEKAEESATPSRAARLDAVIAPCGGGGMLSGIATALGGTGIRVFGAEPSFEGADDARRGVAAGRRVESVKTLTIADGLRTPVGEIPWTVISDPEKVRGLYSVTEDQIKAALKLVLERMKVFVEPSAVVGLAVALFNEDFRALVEKAAGKEGWNLGVVFSGGNTTVEALTKLFSNA
jgi:threonine dehydratase